MFLQKVRKTKNPLNRSIFVNGLTKQSVTLPIYR